MRISVAIQLMVSVLVSLRISSALNCDTANWWSSLDKPGWSTCPRSNTYIKGLYRNVKAGLFSMIPFVNGLYLIEEAKCCEAPNGFSSQSTCRYENWLLTLDRNNVWALCPTGYYLNGIRTSGPKNLHQIEEAKCCRPNNHPDAYADCYDENVGLSFDDKGWSQCNRDGYYMAGFWRGGCDEIYCIEKFRCCRMKSAVINGGWSAFGAWGECSTSCGPGTQVRTRTCTNPPPANGGAQCSGSNKETKDCNKGPCPVDGGWSDHGDWSKCSVTCGSGVQERSRTCTNPPPAYGGAGCSGDAKQTRQCVAGECNTSVNGGWSKWTSWTNCNKTCGKGRKTRTRKCNNPPPSGGGKKCKGKTKQKKKCKIQSCKKPK